VSYKQFERLLNEIVQSQWLRNNDKVKNTLET